MNCRTSLFLILLLSLFAKCKQVTRATDFITNPSAREVYLRALDKDSAGLNSFENVYESAMTDSISADLPYVETGHFWDTNPSASGYTVFLQQGEKFHARLELDSINTKGFFSLFQHTQDSINPLKLIIENLPGENEILYDIKETGDYKIVIQTELLANTPFQLLLYRTPRFSFPVSGKGNAAIQSFWGANRDGGRRSHEGLDIFADRGTPALAAVDGMVSSTGNRGLGGKQVWLRSGIFGNSLYYAHLDSIIASTGQRVKVGDTLGLVGNTGNARTTPPHLHFGIYKRGRGAINPLPFVFEGVAPIPSETNKVASRNGIVNASTANLRNAASIEGKKIGEVKNKDSLEILGISTSWYRVKTRSGYKAYIHQNLLRPTGN